MLEKSHHPQHHLLGLKIALHRRKLLLFASSRVSTSTSLTTKKSTSASAKKNIDTTVAKGKDHTMRASDKV